MLKEGTEGPGGCLAENRVPLPREDRFPGETSWREDVGTAAWALLATASKCHSEQQERVAIGQEDSWLLPF